MIHASHGRSGRFDPLLNREVTPELYDELCPVLELICDQIDASSVPLPSALADWQSWARIFMAGLYRRTTVLQAVQDAAGTSAAGSSGEAIGFLSCAATRGATAVLHAIDGHAALASKAAASARHFAELHRDMNPRSAPNRLPVRVV